MKEGEGTAVAAERSRPELAWRSRLLGVRGSLSASGVGCCRSGGTGWGPAGVER